MHRSAGKGYRNPRLSPVPVLARAAAKTRLQGLGGREPRLSCPEHWQKAGFGFCFSPAILYLGLVFCLNGVFFLLLGVSELGSGKPWCLPMAVTSASLGLTTP